MSLRKRSQSRVLALQALCVFDAVGETFSGDLEDFLGDGVNYADLGWEKPPAAELLGLARTLAAGAWQVRARCDELLHENVPGWSVPRMQPVDRNILRLGLYELLECPGTPPQVVINEAVELARRFGGADSPAFVNGVLDGVWRALLAAGAGPGPAAGTEAAAAATARSGASDPPGAEPSSSSTTEPPGAGASASGTTEPAGAGDSSSGTTEPAGDAALSSSPSESPGAGASLSRTMEPPEAGASTASSAPAGRSE